MSFFSAEDISAGYNGKTVLNNISFQVEKNSITGILGANGSGKTTLLKAICNIINHSGNCILDNQNLNKLSSRELAQVCSYIPQRSGIDIDISLMDVVWGLTAELVFLISLQKKCELKLFWLWIKLAYGKRQMKTTEI